MDAKSFVCCNKPNTKRANLKKLIFCVFILVGCQSSSKITEVIDTAAQPGHDTVAMQCPLYETVSRYDNKVYTEVVPDHVRQFIARTFPDWKFPEPKQFEAFYFNWYKKPNSLINFNGGDFNCDKVQDYVCLLQDQDNKITVWVFISSEAGLTPMMLTQKTELTEPITFGIEIIPTGSEVIDITLFGTAQARSVLLQCEAIKVLNLEISAKT